MLDGHSEPGILTASGKVFFITIYIKEPLLHAPVAGSRP